LKTSWEGLHFDSRKYINLATDGQTIIERAGDLSPVSKPPKILIEKSDSPEVFPNLDEGDEKATGRLQVKGRLKSEGPLQMELLPFGPQSKREIHHNHSSLKIS
jgi:hypothetical protein